MNKIILAVFILAFFLDFSFVPSLFGSGLSWPYFSLSLLTIIFLLNNGEQKDIIWGALAVVCFNVLLPFNLFGYVVIIIIIWGIVYYLKGIFFNQGSSYLKRNFTFVLLFLFFSFFLFVGQNIKAEIIGEENFDFNKVCWKTFSIKILIGLTIFNLIFKLWPGEENNIQALK